MAQHNTHLLKNPSKTRKHVNLIPFGGIAAFLTLMTTCVLAQGPKPGECFPLDSGSVTLSGSLVSHEGIRGWWALRSDHPVCTLPLKDEAGSIPAHTGLGEFHLIITGGQDDFDRYRPYLGKKVRIVGQLTPATTGHHETPVLIMVKSLDPIGPVLPPDARPRYSIESNVFRPNMYRASVTVEPASNRVVVRAWEGTPTKELRPTEAFASFFFNGPKDVMWVNCPSGYSLDGTKSSTASPVFRMAPNDPTNDTWGVSVDAKSPTNINFACRR